MKLLEYQAKQQFAKAGIPIPAGRLARTAEEVGFGGVDGVRFAFILGEIADEGEYLRNVGRRRGTEVERTVLVR